MPSASPTPRPAIDDYPHQFSGGMRQRVMIAMGLSCNPDVLIADEPTTALDVTIQAQILELIGSLQREFDSAVVLITHDLGVVAEVADRVAVMYAGRIVEYAEVGELFRGPQHPYTWGLLGSISRLDRPRQRRLAAITGQPPSLISLPAGCSFRPRCPYAFDRCRAERPALEARSGAGHLDALPPARPTRSRPRQAADAGGVVSDAGAAAAAARRAASASTSRSSAASCSSARWRACTPWTMSTST